MIKVVHVTTAAIALRYLLLNQLLSIQAAGFEVSAISSPGVDVPVLKAAGIHHIPVAMSRNMTPAADLLSLWRLYGVMRRERFTIVHTHNPKPGLLGQLAARMARVPVVINTLHGFYFHEHTPPFWRRFYILMEKTAARCSDVILSQNSEDIVTAVHEGICSPDLIKPLGNGIDIGRFDRRRLSPTLLAQKRAELAVPDDAPVVGFVGRLVQEKGILELMEAAVQIRRQVPDVRFLLIGPIDQEKPDALNPEVAGEYGLDENCIFAGLRDDMPELYSLMDVFVLPSHREGFPRAPMEASAMGVPAVVTDIRGCREAVEHGRNGCLVPLRDAKAVEVAVLDLLGDKEKARQMGQNGRRMAEERFDEQLVFTRVKQEYTLQLTTKGYAPPP
jgi:glycosyltransferase involved in cell wall biosynthesis